MTETEENVTVTKRLLATGSRHYRSARTVRNALDPYRGQNLTLVVGDAPGLDTIAYGVWTSWGEIPVRIAADWIRYGNHAGPIRNQQMVNLGGYIACLAFPLIGSRGTWDCVARARRAHIPVHFPS